MYFNTVRIEKILVQKIIIYVCRRGMFGRVPACLSSGPGSITGGVMVLIYVLGLGVCPLCCHFVFCPVLSPAVVLTCADYTFREVRPCASA